MSNLQAESIMRWKQDKCPPVNYQFVATELPNTKSQASKVRAKKTEASRAISEFDRIFYQDNRR